MAKTVCCIGCGTMGGAIMGGLAENPKAKNYELCGYNRSQDKMKNLEKAGVKALNSIDEAAEIADILILGVKPHQVLLVIEEAGKKLKPDAIVVSLAAGISIAKLRQFMGSEGHLCRCMPTTTALVGKGLFAFCFDPDFSNTEKIEVQGVFELLGTCVEINENMMTDFSALIGAGPAYVFQMMQGLVQAGITLGFTHAQSRKLVCALFEGSAVMAENSGKSLMQLRDEVCSPAGLTIAGVNVLDRTGLTGILVDAILAAKKRGQEMENY